MKREPPVVLFLQPDLGSMRSFRVHLRRRGATVVAVRTTGDLLFQASKTPPDVVVVDVDSERVEAGELMALIHRQLSKALVIALVRVKDPLMWAVRQIVKPATPGILEEAIESRIADRLHADTVPPREAPLILCVDDEPLFLQSLQRLLISHGYRVEASTDPEAALDSIAVTDPSLAILDVRMPGLNGMNMAEELLDSYQRKIPVVLLTALNSDEEISDGYRKGVSYYITKPCDPALIVNVVDYLVGDLDSTERELIQAQL